MFQLFYPTRNIVAVFKKGDMDSYNDRCFESWDHVVAFLDEAHPNQYVMKDIYNEKQLNHGLSGLSILASESLEHLKGKYCSYQLTFFRWINCRGHAPRESDSNMQPLALL